MFQNIIAPNYVKQFWNITRGIDAKYHYKSCNYLDIYFSCIKLIANWWAWEVVPSKVVGDLKQVWGTAGRFHGNPVSENQPCKLPPTSMVTLKELQGQTLPDLIPAMKNFLWGVGRNGCWIGKISNHSSDPQSSTEKASCKFDDQSRDPFNVVIHKDQGSRQLQV